MKALIRVVSTAFLMAAMLSAAALGAEDAVTLSAGTTLRVQLTTTLSSRSSQNGDPWTGRVLEPIFARGEEVLPAGSTVEGRVTFVKEAGRVKGRGEMRLVAETITTPDAKASYTIVASLKDAQGPPGTKVKGEEGTIEGPGKDNKGTAIDAGKGAAAGAAVGAIVHGGSGALYGSAIGAAAALIRGILKHGKDATLPPGTELTFELSRSTLARKVTPPPLEQPAQ